MRKQDVKFSIGVLIGFLIMGLCFSAKSFAADSTTPATGRDLAGIAEIIKAKTDYQRMLTEARIADADIQLKRASAEYAYAKADHLRQVLEVLRHEYQRILREENDVDRRIAEVEWRAGQLRPLKTGHVDSIVTGALFFFIEEVLPAQALKDVMFKKVAPLGEENFVANDFEDGSETRLRAFPGGNLGVLLHFVDTNGLSFVTWSEGHALIIDLVAAVQKSGDEKIDRYHKYMDGIRSGTLPIWQLPQT